ncbi:MAG TPA: serine/threonine-protein kinase [Sandaracinaceae bacterium LLY-WYZ-13_1]|nr:serine/threonine-protein kinase [Sandaracinaceae bacterium LLY-WYZ-13_1]
MEVPPTIGRYRILARLTGGAQETELFKAECLGDDSGTAVCIKRIHPNYDENPLFAERFEQELELAQKLRHRNIVEVSDFGEDDGHYFVMEYVDGPNLDELLRAGPLSPALVTYVGIELCRALSFLHHSDPDNDRKPVIHGDVTPHNVLISRRDGGVKLSDFGLAKALGRTGAETITRARGKPTYLSPEQLQDEKVSARTDLFSLGLVLWRALVGAHPYGEGRPHTRPRVDLGEWIRQRTIANERRSVAEAAPHAPEALWDAIEGLLQPLATRTPTAEDVFNVLRQVEPLDGHAQLVAWVARVGAEET